MSEAHVQHVKTKPCVCVHVCLILHVYVKYVCQIHVTTRLCLSGEHNMASFDWPHTDKCQRQEKTFLQSTLYFFFFYPMCKHFGNLPCSLKKSSASRSSGPPGLSTPLISNLSFYTEERNHFFITTKRCVACLCPKYLEMSEQ